MEPASKFIFGSNCNHVFAMGLYDGLDYKRQHEPRIGALYMIVIYIFIACSHFLFIYSRANIWSLLSCHTLSIKKTLCLRSFIYPWKLAKPM